MAILTIYYSLKFIVSIHYLIYYVLNVGYMCILHFYIFYLIEKCIVHIQISYCSQCSRVELCTSTVGGSNYVVPL